MANHTDRFQNEPVQEGSTDQVSDEAIQGIVDQVSGDIDLHHTHEDVLTLLKERFSQADLDVPDERAQQLAQQITRRND